MTRLPRSIIAALAAGVLLVGCSADPTDGEPTGTDQPADPTGAEPGDPTATGFLDPAAAAQALDTLLAAAGGDQFVHLGIMADELAVLVSDDPTAVDATVTGYRLTQGDSEVAEDEFPPMPNPGKPLTRDQIDLEMIAELPVDCSEPVITVTATGRTLQMIGKGCAEDGSSRSNYWMDGTPVEFAVDDAATVTDLLRRITEGSTGELAGVMLLQDTGPGPDGAEREYASLQVGVVESPDRVLNYTVEQDGMSYARPGEGSIDQPTFQVDELDVDALVSCLVQFRTESGASGVSGSVARVDDRLEYQFQRSDSEDIHTTDADCRPI